MNLSFLPLLLPLVLALASVGAGRALAEESFAPYTQKPILSDAQQIQAFEDIRGLLRQKDKPLASVPEALGYPLHIELYKDGRRIASGHARGGTPEQNLRKAVEKVSPLIGVSFSPDDSQLTVSLTLFYNPTAYRVTEPVRDFLRPGRDGIFLQCDKRRALLPNSRWLVKNRKPGKMIEVELDGIGCTPEDLVNGKANLTRFDTVHLLQSSGSVKPKPLFRGDTVWPLEDVTPEALEQFLSGTEGWLRANLHEDGRLEYKYWPSRDEYSQSNNLIRQWMTTHAMAELLLHGGGSWLKDAWQRNAQYNIDHFLHVIPFPNAYAYYLEENKAKLGTNAVAALALNAIPDERTRFAKEYDLTIRGIRHQMRDDGSFRTWFVPAELNDNQAFYPGESLLALALGIKEGTVDMKPAELKKYVEYYMGYWRKDLDRNTAFVPWHTQAYYWLYELTNDEDYLKYIFEMNDHLLHCQLKEDAANPDAVGHYYVPECKDYGPPHASSTAVYTEGLAYAYDLAQRKGDTKRAEAYRQTIKLGLRSLLQLQVRDSNAWYMRNAPRALGGVRTTITDNTIRCDNIQHAIMAVTAVLRYKAL